MNLNVKYMSGAGNLFTVINAVEYSLESYDFSNIAPKLCGVDSNSKLTEGLIIAKSGNKDYDFVIDFYNPDGSYGMMCGNGGRCAVRFANEAGISSKRKVNFFMAGSEYYAEFIDNDILLELPPPIEFRLGMSIFEAGKEIRGSYVNVGSEHFVVNIEELGHRKVNEVDIIKIAKPIRHNDSFAPKGTNVNIYEVESTDNIVLRTYERGVEAETGACGTGAISTVLIAYLKKEIGLPVTIIPPSGIPISVNILGDIPNKITKFHLKGHAEIIGETNFELDI